MNFVQLLLIRSAPRLLLICGFLAALAGCALAPGRLHAQPGVAAVVNNNGTYLGAGLNLSTRY